MRMPDGPLPPTLLVVGLGIISSLGWGIADFGGGVTSRKAPVVGVLFTSQAASLVVAVPLFLLAGESTMTPVEYGLAAIAGVLSAAGLGTLYRGLSVGRMGVVAPVAAVITAALPVTYGFLTEGIPSELAIIGIAAAVVSVLLVSRTPDAGDGRPSGLRYGVATGFIFGLFPIVTSAISDDVLVAPVVTVRVASVLTIAAFVLLRRPQWRVPNRLLPVLLGIGLTDMLATATFLAAIAVGPLAIAAVLQSLYPVVTVILAWAILKERITPVQAGGILAAGTAVVLIAIA